MNIILKTLRSSVILGSFLFIIYLFAKFLVIPILVFILIMNLFRIIKIRPKTKSRRHSKKTTREDKTDNDVIDGEFEELD